jgi:outer membrane protein assembly factor BamA
VNWRKAVLSLITATISVSNTSASGGSGVDTVRVVVTGAHRISNEQIHDMVSRPGGMERVVNEYAQLGYWNAVIESIYDSSDAVVVNRYRVDEGPLAVLKPIGMSTKIGSQSSFSEWVERTLRRQADIGYPFAQMQIVAVEEHGAGLYALDARLDNGRRVVIANVLPSGNTVTRNRVISRELRQVVPWVYSQEVVDDWRNRLRRTGYFDYVGTPELVVPDSSSATANLIIQVAEGRPNRFEGVVGYQPGSGASGDGSFTGLIDLVLGNLWGTGRHIDARWERPVRETTTLSLRYREPWLAGMPVDGEGSLGVEQRPGYTVEEIGLSLTTDLWLGLSATGSIGREIVRSDSVALLGGPRSRGYVLGASVALDTRDNEMNTVRGLHYRLSWQASYRTNQVDDVDFVAVFGETGWPSDERTSSVRLDVEHYTALGKGFVFAPAWHGMRVTTDSEGHDVTEADQVRIGGVGTLRGYQQEQFAGNLAAWGNHELRYQLGPASRVFCFVDAGVIQWSTPSINGGDLVDHIAWPIGYGFGLRARTGAGVLGIDFGWGRNDTFGDGKVHVGIQSAF